MQNMQQNPLSAQSMNKDNVDYKISRKKKGGGAKCALGTMSKERMRVLPTEWAVFLPIQSTVNYPLFLIKRSKWIDP